MHPAAELRIGEQKTTHEDWGRNIGNGRIAESTNGNRTKMEMVIERAEAGTAE